MIKEFDITEGAAQGGGEAAGAGTEAADVIVLKITPRKKGFMILRM